MMNGASHIKDNAVPNALLLKVPAGFMAAAPPTQKMSQGHL
jgi:hypothetical protein